MNPRTALDRDAIIEQLSRSDSSDSSDSGDAAADQPPSTVRELKAELDTLLDQLRQPAEPDPFAAETGLRRAQELVLAIGAEPESTIRDHRPELGRIGPYELLEKLGEGGMGAVYKALHSSLEKIVALKVLPRDRLTPQAISRFKREMKAVGKLDHHNIVRATDAGEADGDHFLVMEYVDGVDLSELLRRVGPLPAAEACELIRQAAIGLQHAHQRGLVHRDIKPNNIMLAWGDDTEPAVKILDMGLALLNQQAAPANRDLTTTGQMMGTLEYMSPEQGLDTHHVDIRADIYSLGATLYKLLCGKAPFAGERFNTPGKLMVALATETPPSVGTRREDLPPGLVTIVDRMLAKTPADRYATPAEVAEALAPLATGADLRRLADAARQRGSLTDAPADQSITPTALYLSSPSTATTPLLKPEASARELPKARSSVRHPSTANPGPHSALLIPKSLAAVALLALFIVGIFFSGQIIRIVTNQGQIIIETDASGVEVVIKDGEGKVVDTETKREITFKAGEYNIEVTVKDAGGEQRFVTDHFVLTRNDKKIVDARWETAKPKNGEPKSVAPSDELVVAAVVPSPFDALRREDIPPSELAMASRGDPSQVPPELVAVVGDGRLRHWQEVTSIVFSPDGQSLISSSKDQSVKIWDVATGQQKQVLQTYEPESRPIWLALSQDGKTLVTTTPELTKVWELPSGKERQELKRGCFGGSLSQDGSLLLIRRNLQVELIEVSTGKSRVLLKGEDTFGSASALSPDGTLMAVGSTNGALKLFTAAHGKELFDLQGHKGTIDSVMFSPDGRTRASTGHDMTIKVWDVETGKEQQSFTDVTVVSVVAFSADGKHLAAGTGYGKIRIWDTETFTELPPLTVPGRKRRVSSLAFSPDGKTVAAGMYSGIIKMWDVTTGKERFNFPGHQAEVTSLAVAPSSKLLATGSGDATIRLVDVPSLQERFRLTADGSSVLAVTFSPDSQMLFAGTGSPGGLRLNSKVLGWGLDGGKLEHSFNGHGNYVNCVAVSPDGKTLASGDTYHEVRLWDVPTGEKREELMTHKPRLTLKTTGDVSSLAFSPDGTMLATLGGDLRLWDVANGKELRVFKKDRHNSPSLAFSPDGTLLAESSWHSGTVNLTVWEVTTGEEYARIPIPSLAVAFGPGHKLYTAGPNGTVQIWDLTKHGSKRLEKQIRLGPPGGWIEQLVLTPDGRHLLTRNYNGTTYILRLTPTPSTSATNHDRRAAEWVLSIPRDYQVAVQVNDVDRWIGKLDDLPVEPFRLTNVNVEWAPKLDDAGLANFHGCKHIKVLQIQGTQVTEKGLTNFQDCQELRELYLMGDTINDAALELFKNRVHLTALGAQSNQVTDVGVAHFQGRTNLTKLHLPHTQVTDLGLAYFKDNKKLKSLSLGGTKVTDAGLAHFAGCPDLETLQLFWTPVSDTGLAHFKDCKNLKSVDLNRVVQVTDEGLANFAGCPKLGSINIRETKVTEAGVKNLAAALPGCKIEWDGGVIEPRTTAMFTNALGMEFALVPKGKAWLGGGGGKPGEKEYEVNQDFYLGVYEVTQQEWTQVTGENPSGFQTVEGVATADRQRFPVDNVSWNDAQQFLKLLNEKAKEPGWIYRLPTDAEWEYACRGGPIEKAESAFDYYFDKPTLQLLPEQANFTNGSALQRTCPVGSYSPNRLGLHDMHGNVWELCDDLLQGRGVVTQLMRGGSWITDDTLCRAALNFGTGAHSKNHSHGLRVARVAGSPEVSKGE